MKAILVDDEPLALGLMRQLLAGDSQIEIIQECTDGREAIDAIRTLNPDLLLLDVQMPGLTGFEVLEQIPQEQMPYVVFVTAHDRHAVQAFDVQAVDYLLKPFEKRRFRQGIERAKSAVRGGELQRHAARVASLASSYARARSSADSPEPPADGFRARFLIRAGNVQKVIRTVDVCWIEAANQYARLHTSSGVHLVSRSLAQLERELDPGSFCRTHRSVVVNTAFVQAVRTGPHGAYVVVLRDGTRLPLSRRRRALALRRLAETS